jgi:hypothetical protein
MSAVSRTFGILVVTLALAAPAGAETILITSGLFNWARSTGPTATVTLAGDGFTFGGRTGSGVFDPLNQCTAPECVPGASVSLRTVFAGLDLPGAATYNGVTYTGVGGLMSPTSLSAQWSGTLLIPNDFTGGILTAPFQFTGLFLNPSPAGSLDLVGSGLTTLSFTPYANVPGAPSASRPCSTSSTLLPFRSRRRCC